MKRHLTFLVFLAIIMAAAAPVAIGTPVNTTNQVVIDLFQTNAQVQTFENLSPPKTPVSGIDTNYANALNSSLDASNALLSLDILGLLFHSGGGSFNDPIGNPGTPTALLTVPTATDAHSPSTVVGSLEINTTNLDLDNFVEIVFINALQNRVGVFLNPSLGDVTFTAFDSSGGILESFTGNAGNFVGVERPTNDIKFISIVGAAGFTIDDLTYAGATTPTEVPEPTTMLLLGSGLLGLAGYGRRKFLRK